MIKRVSLFIFRPISGLTFISKPEYSDDELQEIKDRNNEGFEIDGKKYTRYQGTQMQRKLESEIRKQKDIQIMSRASGQDDLVRESQPHSGHVALLEVETG